MKRLILLSIILLSLGSFLCNATTYVDPTNTAVITGGTIDGTVIGGNTPATGTFTILKATTGSAAGNILISNATGTLGYLAAGATTDILVGGGAANPVWTSATGTGAPVRANTPTLITPVLGVATATTINKITFTQPANGATLTLTDSKTLSVTETLTLNALPVGGLAVATSANTLGSLAVGATTEILVGGGAGTVPIWTSATGSGSPVRATSPILVAPTLGVATATSETIKGTTGGYTKKFSEATATLSGASTTIETNIPANSRILGVQLRVDTAITSGDGATTWSASYSGGSTDAICSGQVFTKNTKVNNLTEWAVVASETDIIITPNSGTFSAGVIRVIVYYENFDVMADL